MCDEKIKEFSQDLDLFSGLNVGANIRQIAQNTKFALKCPFHDKKTRKFKLLQRRQQLMTQSLGELFWKES